MKHEIPQQRVAETMDMAVADVGRMQDGKTSPWKTWARVYRRMDAAMMAVTAPIDCREGCSFCCHYRVMVSAPEALAMAEFVSKRMSKKAALSVRIALRATVDRLESISPQDHLTTNVKCAFLDNAGACTAYEARPSACRRHHSAKREACEVSFYDPHSEIQNEQHVSLLQEAELHLMAARKAQQISHLTTTHYELATAVEVALRDKTAFTRWRDGKDPFPSVRDRERPPST